MVLFLLSIICVACPANGPLIHFHSTCCIIAVLKWYIDLHGIGTSNSRYFCFLAISLNIDTALFRVNTIRTLRIISSVRIFYIEFCTTDFALIFNKIRRPALLRKFHGIGQYNQSPCQHRQKCTAKIKRCAI